MNSWYVLKTKPKKEDDVSVTLRKAGITVFLPKMKGLIAHKPLFPSYLFVRSDFNDPYHHRIVRFARGVHKILGDGEGPQPIPDLIVDTLKERTHDGALIEQELLFKEGESVIVKRGILKDLIGIIEKNISDSGRVKVLFKWMNSSMRAVFRYVDLEKAA